MSNSTTILDLLTSSQPQKEVTANALFDSASPATAFARRASTSAGLTWGYYGGSIWVDGVMTQISNGTVALTASATNYVEMTRAGTVSKNTTAFTAGSYPLYQVVTGASTVTSYTDHRVSNAPITGYLSKAITDANTTLTYAESRVHILRITGTLTAQRDIIVPAAAWIWIVDNGTSGGFGIQVKPSGGTGVVVATATKKILYADGTNVVAAT